MERLSKLLQPDTLKMNVGEPGSIETTFVDYKIPSLTVEMGQAKVWNTSLIDRTVAFVERVVLDLHVTPGYATVELDLTDVYIANILHDTYTKFGGLVERLVGVDDVGGGGDPSAAS